MPGKPSPALPGAFVAFLVTAQTWKEGTAFQAPVIFPLLWLSKRLIQTHDSQALSGQIPILPRLKSLAGVEDRHKQKGDDANAKRLFEWLNGFKVSSSSVRIGTNAQGLRGLHATRNIRKGDIIVEIPLEAALLVGDSLSPPPQSDFDGFVDAEDLDDVYQGLNFLSLRHNRDHAPYLDTLPPKPSPGDEAGLTPDFWSDAVISDLQIPSFVNRVLRRKDIVEEVAKKHDVDEHDLRWATWILRSRRITTYNMVNDPNREEDGTFGVFPSRRGRVEQMQGFLLPLIDMANHAHDPNAILKLTVNPWTRNIDDTSKFSLRALRPINKGEEATILYGEGDRTSWDLLDKYGFFLEGNKADRHMDWEELEAKFRCSPEEDERELAMLEREPRDGKERVLDKTKRKLKTIVAKIQPDYVPTFASKLGPDLHLVGTGLRQKMGINIYAVAMYLPASLDATRVSSREDLRNAARSFGASFVLEIIFQPDTADTIAKAISRSVKLRYPGSPGDVRCLEDLIAKCQETGKATKGSVLQFDCTADAVRVSFNGIVQGTALCQGVGSAFVDMFLDCNTVSPSLVSDCLERREEHAVTVQNMAVGRRTMLSFRILMKRLSNWTESKDFVDAEEVEPQEELIVPEIATNAETFVLSDKTAVDDGKINGWGGKIASKLHKGAHLSEAASDVTDKFDWDVYERTDLLKTDSGVSDESNTEMTDAEESDVETFGSASIQEELVVSSELYEETDLSESASLPDAGNALPLAPGGLNELQEAPVTINEPNADRAEDVDLFEAGSGGFDASNAEMIVSSPKTGDVATSKSATVDTNDSFSAEPGNGIAMNDSAKFDVTAVESRIRELEAEIQAEIGRVKAPQSARTLPTAVAVEPDQKPLSITMSPISNHVASTDEPKHDVPSLNTIDEGDQQVASKETATFGLESREIQKKVDQKKIDTVEAKMKSLKDKATGVTFAATLEDGLYLVGVGVRKKAILNIYSVALYSHISALEALSPFSQRKQKKEAQLQLRNAARTFDASSPTTSLVLEMVFKADAETIAGAIAEQVRPRYTGPTSNVEELENLIIEGVNNKGGQATKGTTFRFDCTAQGVKFAIDGKEQGIASFEGMGSAFVDVFLDEKAVSSTLVDSCLSTWCESALV